MEQEGIFQLNRYLGAGHFLVRHPGPYKTESLFGYLLRLSEINGYWSVWPLLQFVDMKQFEARTAGMRVEKIAKIAKRTLSELEEIAYYIDDDYTHCHLLNHSLLPTHLRLTEPAFCPACVREKKHIEAHWDLVAVTGCAVHRCQLLTICPQCTEKLTIFRRGLLKCACGADFSQLELPAIPMAESELLDVIRRTVLGMPPLTESQVGLPLQHLAGMELHPLLGLIHVLGRLSRDLSPGTAMEGNPSDTALASDVLSNWPVKFHELLVSMITNEKEGFAGFSRGALRSLYSGLFKNQSVPDRAQFEFVLRACADFTANRWGYGLADRKLLVRFGMTENQRYVGIGATAKELGLHQKTAKRLLDRESCAVNVASSSDGERLVIDKQALKVKALQPGKIYWLREAAAKIGISVALLKSLRKHGEFEVNCTPEHYRGFHESDIETFITKILGTATAGDGTFQSFKSLKAALHRLRFSLEAQHELIRRICRRGLPVEGSNATQISELLLREEDISAVMKDCCPWYLDTITGGEAAKLLGVSVEDICPLTDNGYLERKTTPLGERITLSSAEHFRRSYTPAETIAKSLGTSARKVMDMCRRRQIPLLIIEIRNLDHALVRAEHEGRVRHAYEFPNETSQSDTDRTRPSATCAETDCKQRDEAPIETRLLGGSLAPEDDTLTYLEAAATLRVGKQCIRLMLAAKYLDFRPTSLGNRITRISVEQFANRYVSLQAIAENQNTQPRTVRKLCDSLELPLITLRSRLFKHSFANRKDVPLIVESLKLKQSNASLAARKKEKAEEAA